MKVCYLDESGTGSEPYAVMSGIVVDAARMHLTKVHWRELLSELSRIIGRSITEFHAADFYSGNSPWRDISGHKRANIISFILQWLLERRHILTFCAVDKAAYRRDYATKQEVRELTNYWCFMAFHQLLIIQKQHQRFEKRKGNTIVIFDEHERDKNTITDLAKDPPVWSNNYYNRARRQRPLDEIIDIPYFGASHKAALVQIADLVSYILRRYAEIKERKIATRYADEEAKIEEWAIRIANMSYPASSRYPAVGRNVASDIFYQLCPPSLRSLGR